MTTQKLNKRRLNSLVKEVASALAVNGFERRGLIFKRRVTEVLHLVEIQPSWYSGEDCVRFTINIGVLSYKLDELWPELTQKRPIVADCQIRTRLGKLLPNADDKWWSIAAGDSIVLLFAEIIAYIQIYAIPFLNRLRSDSDLESLLENRRVREQANLEDLIHLCALYGLYGKHSQYEGALKAAQEMKYRITGTTNGGPIDDLLKLSKRSALNTSNKAREVPR